MEKKGAAANRNHARIGNLIEAPGIYPFMSGYKNLKCKALALGINKPGYPEELLALVGLEHAGKKKVKKIFAWYEAEAWNCNGACRRTGFADSG